MYFGNIIRNMFASQRSSAQTHRRQPIAIAAMPEQGISRVDIIPIPSHIRTWVEDQLAKIVRLRQMCVYFRFDTETELLTCSLSTCSSYKCHCMIFETIRMPNHDTWKRVWPWMKHRIERLAHECKTGDCEYEVTIIAAPDEPNDSIPLDVQPLLIGLRISDCSPHCDERIRSDRQAVPNPLRE